MSLINTILSLIFPSSCLACGRGGEYFCENCLKDLPLAENPEEDFIYSVFNYRDKAVKRAVWLLKYNGKYSIATILARAMSDKIAEELSELEAFENFTEPVVIPIPLSKKRLKERGFNQAELLAKATAEKLGVALKTGLLKKIKDTPPQARTSSRKQRFENIRGSFEVAPDPVLKEARIVLIDDVLTTGATMSEAASALKKAGAKIVIGAVAARG